MATKSDKEKYLRLIPEGADPMDEELPCFYCDNQAAMDDYTPNAKAPAKYLEEYEGDWTVVRCCKKCWGAIYTANIANRAAKFGGHKGMMTLLDKASLIGKRLFTSKMQTVKRLNVDFAITLDPPIVIPVGTIFLDNAVQCGQHSLTMTEVSLLQGLLSICYLNLSDEIKEQELSLLMTILDPAKQDIYRDIIGLRVNDNPIIQSEGIW